MTDRLDAKDESLPLTVAERIDRVCLDFEAAWKAGRTPRIEDYLGDAQGAERRGLLRELLLLELDYRFQSGQTPAPFFDSFSLSVFVDHRSCNICMDPAAESKD